MINYRYFCFYSDLQIDFDYLENDFIIVKDYKIYRNVKLFLQHFKKEIELDVVIINDENAQKFLFESIKLWIESKSTWKRNMLNNNLNVFCNQLYFQFVLIEKKRQRIIVRNQTRFDEQKTTYRLKQQQKQKIEKIRLTIFACRRCSAKFSSNTKFHQHI